MDIKNKTLYELLKESKKLYGSKIALNLDYDSISYDDILKNVDIVSNKFNNLNIKSGTINLLLKNCIEAIYVLFAANKVGLTINYINYDLDKNYIDKNIDENILIIDYEDYIEYEDIIKYKKIENIIILNNKDLDEKNIINWEDFLNSEESNETFIERAYNEDYIFLKNSYKNLDKDIIDIYINELSFSNSINNIFNSNLNLKNQTLLNTSKLYDYVGFNLSFVIPLLLGCTVILSNKKDTINLIKKYDPNYIIGRLDTIYKLALKNINIKRLSKIVVINNRIDNHKEEVIRERFNCRIYKCYDMPEINNVLGLKMDTDLKIMDIKNNIELEDNSVGKILLRSDSYCENYKNGVLSELNDENYYETDYIGKFDDNKLEIIDTLKKEIQRINMRKTGLASVDRPWMKYFPEGADNDSVAKLTLYENLRESNKDNYTNIALTYMGEEIKFYELFNNIEKVAKSLTALGVKKGDYVTFCMPNMPEFVYTFYAVNKIGAISYLIEPRTPASKIKGSLEESGSKYLFIVDLCKNNIDKIVDMKQLKHVVSVSPVECFTNKSKKKIYNMTHKQVRTGGKYINYKTFIKMGESFENVKTVHYKKDTVVSVLNTSGTTGNPKGALLTNESYNGQSMQLKYSGLEPKPGEIFLGNIPFFSAYGSSSGMHNALSSGVTIALIPSYKYDDFPKLIKKYKPTHVMGVPRFFELLAESKIFTKSDLSFVKNTVSGGDKMTPNREYYVNDSLNNLNTDNLKKGLGMSEFGGGFITTVNDEVNKVGSVGIPHVGNNVMIVDPDTGKEIEYGVDNVGELYVTGPTMMKGYLNREEENNKFFYIDESGTKWAKTGDLVYMDMDGVIFFMDRMKNVIMRPEGLTVPLLPIENIIDKCKYVESCAVVGINEHKNKTGKYPMAFIVLKNDIDKTPEQVHNEILKDMNKLLPARKQPKWYRYVDKIPYTLSGKVNMKKLEEIGDNDKNKKATYLNLQKNNDKE